MRRDRVLSSRLYPAGRTWADRGAWPLLTKPTILVRPNPTVNGLGDSIPGGSACFACRSDCVSSGHPIGLWTVFLLPSRRWYPHFHLGSAFGLRLGRGPRHKGCRCGFARDVGTGVSDSVRLAGHSKGVRRKVQLYNCFLRGYKSRFRHWAAFECFKKFGIMLIITFLTDPSRFSPELAATVLVIFLGCAAIAVAVSEPFFSSLINNLHLACDFLPIFVLLTTGLLSTSVGRMWPGEVETMSTVVVSYAACLLAGLFAISLIEAGSILRPGSGLHTVWQKFLHSSVATTVVSVAHRTSVVLQISPYSGVVPEAASVATQPAEAGNHA